MEKIQINIDAGNIFLAVGLDDSNESIKDFSNRSSEIGQKIAKALVGREERYSRSQAIADIQDKFNPAEILLLAFHHIEERVQMALEEARMEQFLQTLPEDQRAALDIISNLAEESKEE